MQKHNTELVVGVFVVLGLLAMAWLSIRLGDVEIFGKKGYIVYAEFDSTSGLREGAIVEMAGVEIGTIEKIRLEEFMAQVQMRVKREVNIPDDTIASIRTSGLIGEKFVKLNPGGSDEWIKPGDRITDTEASVDIEELISKYIYSLE